MKKRILAMLLAMMMFGSLASCAADDTAETNDAAETAAGGNEAETEPAWQFPDVDYGGAEYRILNFDQLWDMYIHMDIKEQTGDILDDAVYDRNRKVEDALNCVIAEKEVENTTNVPADLIDLATAVNEVNPISLSVVDTFGAMFEEDLERIVRVLDKHLNPEIQMGFHSHNNQQLSFALTMHFIEMQKKSGRDAVVDASLCGMGRGAGNATTELVVSYMNKKCGTHYDMDAVMDAIDIYMEYFKENYEWGYSTPYFIAGLYCCHVNNIAYLLNNHRTHAKDMRNIIESLDHEDRKKYDYDLLEQKYLQNCNHDLNDTQTVADLTRAIGGREVLLVAPGKSAVQEKAAIDAYIREKNPVVIGVNAILPDYDYDYVFYANPARYEYAEESNANAFASFKRILLSNIKPEPDANEYVIALNSVVKRGWVHFDNGMICALRLMDRLGVKNVSITGFDGFKARYNQSYADPFLPSLKTDSTWNELNREIKSMFEDVKASAQKTKNISFLTPSLFAEEE